MASNDKECKGCISYKAKINHVLYCDMPFKIHNTQCPCIGCIVMTTCVNANYDCDRYREYDYYTEYSR